MRHANLIFVFAACFPTENAPTEGAPTAAGMTYRQDVQPLVARSCQGCHTEGGIAPFALDTYEQAQRNAGAMAGATLTRDVG